MAERNFRELIENKWSEGKFVCVGLDTNALKPPQSIRSVPNQSLAILLGWQSALNILIVDSISDIVCAYKPNVAFYESRGIDGILSLKLMIEQIKKVDSKMPIILDAKRADIGNTNIEYARYAFDYLGTDAITVHPYLGEEALRPFLDYKDKGIFVLSMIILRMLLEEI